MLIKHYTFTFNAEVLGAMVVCLNVCPGVTDCAIPVAKGIFDVIHKQTNIQNMLL